MNLRHRGRPAPPAPELAPAPVFDSDFWLDRLEELLYRENAVFACLYTDQQRNLLSRAVLSTYGELVHLERGREASELIAYAQGRRRQQEARR